MFSFLKPKWQHRNPKVRIDAIQQGKVGTELLLSLAKTDSDVDVRIEAFKKVEQANDLYTLLLHEPCDQGKKAILQQLLSIFEKSDNPQKAVYQFMKVTIRRDFPMANLLLSTNNTKLKLILMPFVSRFNELQDLIDAGYQFPLEEVEVIKDYNLLVYLAKNYKSSDKKINNYLKDIIQQLEDSEKKRAAKESLLIKYQSLVEAERLPALNIFSELENEWNALDLGDENKKYRDEYLARYHAYNQRRQQKVTEFAVIEEKYKNKMLENSELYELFSVLEQLTSEETFSIKEKVDVQTLIKQLSEWQQNNKKNTQFNKVASKVVQDVRALLDKPYRLSASELEKAKGEIAQLPAETKYRTELLSLINQRVGAQTEVHVFDEVSFSAQLEELEALIKKGALQAATSLRENLQGSLKNSTSQEEYSQYSYSLRQVASSLEDQMEAVRWGAFRALEELCDSAEELVNKNHPSEYISIMLKGLRDDWSESQKGIERVPHRLQQRFENACRKAHQKIVATRNQDNDTRLIYKEEAESLLSILTQYINQIDWQSPKWDELLDMRQKFLQEWNRYLNQYSTDGVLSYGAPLFLSKDKNYFERSMRKILKPLEDALQKERKSEKKRRQQIIADLKLLVDAGNIKDAVEQSKLASKKFIPTVRLPRYEENILWKELRLINDQVFALREEVLSVEESERAQNSEKKYTLLKELTELQSYLDHNVVISEVYQKLDEIDAKWLEIGVVPKRDYHKLESDLKGAANKIRDRLRGIVIEKEAEERRSLLEISMAIGQLEYQAVNNESITISDDLLANSDALLRKRIKCLEQIMAKQSSALQFLLQKNMHAEEKAKELVLLREIILDKPIIEEEREERLALQVKVLEKSMNNSRNEKDKVRQLKRLDNDWLENVVGKISDKLYERFQ